MRVLDLSLPLAHGKTPYVDPSGYSDPPTTIEPWVSIDDKRGDWTSPFHVSRLGLSAHAGTHIDAPSHFHRGAATMSGLPLETLAGRAVVIDLRNAATDPVHRLRGARERASQPDATPLILTPPAWLTLEAVDEVVAWQRPLVVFAGEEEGDAGFAAVSRLLGAGRWMVANLNPDKAALVLDGDLLVVAPLAVGSIEASPCRVLALRM